MPDFSAIALFPEPLKLSPPWSWAGHIPFAMWLVEQCKPQLIVELGSHSGHSYFSFCQSARLYSPKTRCYAVDTWTGDHQTGFYGEEIFSDVFQHNATLYSDFSTLLRMRFDEALDSFSDHSIDLLHIDGLHTYEAVKHDFETWLPKMSAQGLMLFHDIAVQHDDFGVWKLWEELSLCYPHLSFNHSFGLGVLVVGEEPDETMRVLAALCEEPTGRSLVQGLFAEAGKRTELQRELTLKDLHIAERIAMIVERDRIITARIAMIVERDRIITEQADIITEQADIITKRDSTIAEQEDELAGLRMQLRIFTASRSWRVTKPLRKLSNSYRKRTAKPLRKLSNSCRKRWSTLRDILLLLFNGKSNTKDYEKWIEQFDATDEKQLIIIRAEIMRMKNPPLISVLMPVYNPDTNFLNEAISSVCNQVYPHWELCIADDCSSDPDVKKLIIDWTLRDKRIRPVFRQINGHISAASNSALEITTGRYVALLDHDDLLHPLALYWNAKESINHPDAGMIYSDEDKIDESDVRNGPYFKSDFNYDLLLCHNMISHLGLYNTALIKRIGGFVEGLEGSQDYDLALRVVEQVRPEQIRHIPRVLYHWRIHEKSTAMSIDAKPYALVAAISAVKAHLERQGIDAIVTDAQDAPVFNRVIYAVPSPAPSIEILVHYTDNAVNCKHCIDAILHKTTYSNYSISIIDHGSTKKKSLSFFEQLKGRSCIKVIHHKTGGNSSTLNNQAAAASSADYLCLLNNSIEVLSPDWLTEMVGHALQKGVGAVGAKLLSPNNTLLHGGIIMGIGNVAGYPHKNLNNGDPGYIGRACLQQSFSALAGGCLVVNRQEYLKAGGLNSKYLEQELGEIDFCLKLSAKGLRNIWTPYAEMRLYPSPELNAKTFTLNRGKRRREIRYMKRTWKSFIEHDPAYSPNLSITSEDFSYAYPPRISPKPFQRKKIMINFNPFLPLRKALKRPRLVEQPTICTTQEPDSITPFEVAPVPLPPMQRFAFPDSELAHRLLDGLWGIEIGGSAHNSFNLPHCLNIDYCGNDDTIFKQAEIDLCGSAMKVDIVSEGDDLPFKDNTFGFVITSHVVEHYFDPIKAMMEWYRIIKPGGYIFTIAPHVDRVPDEHRPVTPFDVLLKRHLTGVRTEEDDAMAGGARGHHAVFNLDNFLELCRYLNYRVVATEDPDKKVGNGFTVVVQKE